MTTHLRVVLALGCVFSSAASAQDVMRVRPRGDRVAATANRQVQIAELIGDAQMVRIQRADGRTEQVPASSIDLRTGDILGATVGTSAGWLRLGDSEGSDSVAAPDSVLAAPFRFVVLRGTATRVLVVTTIPTTLTLDRVSKNHRGTVNFLLRDSIEPSFEGPLARPVQFSAVVPIGRVSPSNFSVNRINLPPTSVNVTTTTTDDSIPLHLSTTLNPEGGDVWIRVEQPRIQSEPAHRTIWGWGLQKTNVHVTLPDEAGTTRLTVRLRAATGDLTPTVIALSGGETGNVSMRSKGFGVDTVWANAGRFKSEPTVVHYSFPLTFLLSTLLGGLAGAGMLIARARRDHKKSAPGKYLLEGIITGFVVAVLFALGINLSGFPIPAGGAEAAFVAVAALAAIVGSAGIIKLIEAKFGVSAA